MCNWCNKCLYKGSTTYLKLSFRILGVRNTHDFVIRKLWKTLQVWHHSGLCVTEKAIQVKRFKAASYIKVPEGEDGDNHRRGGPAFAVGAVEDEGRVGVLGQGALHGLQELIKVLKTKITHPRQYCLFSFYPSSKRSIRNRSGNRHLN